MKVNKSKDGGRISSEQEEGTVAHTASQTVGQGWPLRGARGLPGLPFFLGVLVPGAWPAGLRVTASLTQAGLRGWEVGDPAEGPCSLSAGGA